MNKKLLSMMLMGGVAFAGVASAHGDDKFKTMDANSDGKISSAEHAAGVTRMFSSMDKDADGFVTAAEMDAYAMGMKPSAGKGMKAPEMSAAEKIKTMDTDSDGKLSTAEHDSGAASMFTKMDKDGDGSISRGEMESGRAHMMHDDKMQDGTMKSDQDKPGATDAGSGNDAATPPGGNGS